MKALLPRMLHAANRPEPARLKLFVCAGEPSGDALLADVLRALRARCGPHAELAIVGAGGALSEAEGLMSLIPLEDLAVSGVGDVLAALPRLVRGSRRLAAALRRFEPDVVLLVDYPGMNRGLWRAAKALGKPVCYLAPPQLWARRDPEAAARRWQALAPGSYVQALFPFEAGRWRGLGAEVGQGHRFDVESVTFRKKSKDGILLCPGSRWPVVRRNLRAWLAALGALERGGSAFAVERAVVLVPAHLLGAAQALGRAFAARRETAVSEASSGRRHLAITFTCDKAEALSETARALCHPGTMTLELALAGLPFAAVGLVDWFTWWVARRRIGVGHVALPNVLLGERLYPEWVGLRRDFGPAVLADVWLQLSKAEPGLNRVGDRLRAVMGAGDGGETMARAILRAWEKGHAPNQERAHAIETPRDAVFDEALKERVLKAFMSPKVRKTAMKRMRRAVLAATLAATGVLAATDRYEAEDAMVDANLMQKIADASASGGFIVNMKDGALSFKVTVAEAGFYTLWATYSQPYDANGKIQNLAVNGSATGQVAFPFVEKLTRLKASAKIKLKAGANTVEIQKSWGWVNIDYVELTPFEATPFQVAPALVSPKSSENARKLYAFLRENFQKKIISGFMTNTVFENDGKYTPNTVLTQAEAVWIKNASGKIPALVGLDFMHGTGLNSDQQWHQGYTRATLSMAEDTYNRGGIPAYCWHWKDPGRTVEAFYSKSSGNTPFVSFDLTKACTDSTCTAFNTGSVEYKAILADLDTVAGYLKILADKKVPVLWRPLHEASGRWFWWGYSGPKPCKALWKLMFDRFTGLHGLDNLLWVWTTDEAADALDWYPGDAYVDIVGRDYYYYPRVANHGSLVASFEKLKEIFGGRKMITLSENGSVPHPDSLQADGAAWSYFMPWYGDYTMDGWAHDNTADDWKSILASSYVLTLDEMPGWNAYVPTSLSGSAPRLEDLAASRNRARRLGPQVHRGRVEYLGPDRHALPTDARGVRSQVPQRANETRGPN